MSAPCNFAEEALSSGSSAAHDSQKLFQELLDRLRDCHDNAVQGLQSKVDKLRKERCLDAQRLEEFYNKNQHLCEQKRALQDIINVLNERLKIGPCDHCIERAKQKETQSGLENHCNLQFVNELMTERDMLKEENRNLHLKLERLHSRSSLQASFSEPEENMIPDSPLQPVSFPTTNKMKRKRDKSHVRYAEKLLSQPLPDLQNGEAAIALSCRGGAMLVPETCNLEATCVTNIHTKIDSRTVVAETCKDLCCEQDSESDLDCHTVLQIVDKQEQMKKDSRVCRRTEVQELMNKKASPKSSMSSKPVGEVNAKELSKRRTCEPGGIYSCTPSKNSLVSQNCSPYEQSWSLDPEAALSQYYISSPNHPEPKAQAVNVDMDCTYVNHTLLVASRKQAELDLANSITGIGQKANDSLANIFDTTSVEEYESCPRDDMTALDSLHVHEEEYIEQEKKEKQQDFQMEETELMIEHCNRPSTQATKTPIEDAAAEKSFACMLVVRKKAERRKLQGHTCKECEIYYADLPEEEKKKKLSSCSRHRFHYIPPSTPENFWEVGFPSTQTCKERGYIKEDNKPDPRLRRRTPYLVTFSPKAKALQL